MYAGLYTLTDPATGAPAWAQMAADSTAYYDRIQATLVARGARTIDAPASHEPVAPPSPSPRRGSKKRRMLDDSDSETDASARAVPTAGITGTQRKRVRLLDSDDEEKDHASPAVIETPQTVQIAEDRVLLGENTVATTIHLPMGTADTRGAQTAATTRMLELAWTPAPVAWRAGVHTLFVLENDVRDGNGARMHVHPLEKGRKINMRRMVHPIVPPRNVLCVQSLQGPDDVKRLIRHLEADLTSASLAVAGVAHGAIGVAVEFDSYQAALASIDKSARSMTEAGEHGDGFDMYRQYDARNPKLLTLWDEIASARKKEDAEIARLLATEKYQKRIDEEIERRLADIDQTREAGRQFAARMEKKVREEAPAKLRAALVGHNPVFTRTDMLQKRAEKHLPPVDPLLVAQFGRKALIMFVLVWETATKRMTGFRLQVQTTDEPISIGHWACVFAPMGQPDATALTRGGSELRSVDRAVVRSLISDFALDSDHAHKMHDDPAAVLSRNCTLENVMDACAQPLEVAAPTSADAIAAGDALCRLIVENNRDLHRVIDTDMAYLRKTSCYAMAVLDEVCSASRPQWWKLGAMKAAWTKFVAMDRMIRERIVNNVMQFVENYICTRQPAPGSVDTSPGAGDGVDHEEAYAEYIADDQAYDCDLEHGQTTSDPEYFEMLEAAESEGPFAHNKVFDDEDDIPTPESPKRARPRRTTATDIVASALPDAITDGIVLSSIHFAYVAVASPVKLMNTDVGILTLRMLFAIAPLLVVHSKKSAPSIKERLAIIAAHYQGIAAESESECGPWAGHWAEHMHHTAQQLAASRQRKDPEELPVYNTVYESSDSDSDGDDDDSDADSLDNSLTDNQVWGYEADVKTPLPELPEEWTAETRSERIDPDDVDYLAAAIVPHLGITWDGAHDLVARVLVQLLRTSRAEWKRIMDAFEDYKHPQYVGWRTDMYATNVPADAIGAKIRKERREFAVAIGHACADAPDENLVAQRLNSPEMISVLVFLFRPLLAKWRSVEVEVDGQWQTIWVRPKPRNYYKLLRFMTNPAASN